MLAAQRVVKVGQRPVKVFWGRKRRTRQNRGASAHNSGSAFVLQACNENGFIGLFPLRKLSASGAIDTTSEMEVGPGIQILEPYV